MPSKNDIEENTYLNTDKNNKNTAMNTKLIIHIVISLISLKWINCLLLRISTRLQKHNSQLKKQSKLPEKLYFMSTYPALIWYVLPFIEQPRMHGIYDWLNGEFVFLMFCIFQFLFCCLYISLAFGVKVCFSKY